MIYAVHTDGGARGNPGPAAIGIVVYQVDLPWSEVRAKLRSHPQLSTSGVECFRLGKSIGNTTNNVAEYTAVLEAVKLFKKLPTNQTVQFRGLEVGEREKPIEAILFYLDSLLVVNQLTGLYKIKEPTLSRFAVSIHTAIKILGIPVAFHHIPRALNSQADREVNRALDILM